MPLFRMRSGRSHPHVGRPGKHLIAFALLFAFGLLPAARAQQLTVVSAEPAQGSAGVPLQDTVFFDFSAAVTVATDWDGLFTAEPRSRIVRRGAALCIQARGTCAAGDQTVPRFVRLPVEHVAETDYTWFVEAVQTPSGEVMSEPFTLHYTTAAAIGERHVRGTLTPATAVGKRAAAPSPGAAHALRAAAAHLEREGMGTLSYRAFGGNEDRFAASTSQAAGHVAVPVSTTAGTTAGAPVGSMDGPGHTRVLLLTNFFTDSQLWSVRGGTTMRAAEGAYDIPYVRAGRYWPLAVRYADAAATVIEELGFYDPDGDGAPNPIEVEEADDATGVELTMYAFAPATALARVETASTLAAEIASDQELKAVESVQQLYADGTAYTWSYTYYSPSLEQVITVRVDPLGADTLTAPDMGEMAARPSLDPSRIVDSDAALQRVLDGGGAAFIAPFPERRRYSRIASSMGDASAPGGEPQWEVTLQGRTSSGLQTYIRFVTMYSGSVVASESPLAGVEPEVELTVFPTPFRESVTIAYSVAGGGAGGGPVGLSIYDVLGRRIAFLGTGTGAFGTQTVQWDGRDASGSPVPAGLYVVRLETPAGAHVRTITRIR